MTNRGILIIVALMPILAAGCKPTSGEEEAPSAAVPEDSEILTLSEQAAANASVGTSKVGEALIEKVLVLQGEVHPVPEKLASIVARLEGVVTRIAIKEGDHVKKGDAIVTIESKKLAESKLAYIESEHKLEFARKALDREKQLIEKKITSKEEYQKVEHDLEEAALGHSAALQRLKLLGFSEKWLHKLEKNPNQKMTVYTLRAPFSGEVIKKDVTVGEAVMDEKTLFNLADLSELQVEIKVPMASIPLFKKDDTMTVSCGVLDLKTEGVVTFIASAADSQTRTIPVRVTIANPEGKWRPGMPAKVKVENASYTVPLAVPLVAVQEVEGRPAVFVQTQKNSYRLVHVELGEKDDKHQEIIEGLKAGAQVATVNSLVLKSEYLKRQGE